MKDKNNVSSAFAHNVITSMQYRRFWVTWTGGLIKLGCDGETTPIVTLTNEYPDLSYVAFGVLREVNPVEWKLECEFRATYLCFMFSSIILFQFDSFFLF